MKQAIQNFIEPHLPLPGLAAWGARFPDRSFESHCYNDWFTTPQVEKMLARLSQGVERIAQQGIQPIRLCWVFEHARIHLSRRSDGACIACFVENRSDLNPEPLEQLLNEFAAMPTE